MKFIICIGGMWIGQEDYLTATTAEANQWDDLSDAEQMALELSYVHPNSRVVVHDANTLAAKLTIIRSQ